MAKIRNNADLEDCLDPHWITDVPPEWPNVFTDWGVCPPRNPHLALGGCGIHHPADGNCNDVCFGTTNNATNTNRFTHDAADTAHPRDTFARIKHHVTNSTRCVLTILTIAFVEHGPAHIATDRKSILIIANKVADLLYTNARSIAIAQTMPIQLALQHTGSITPATTPWALQKDGNLKRAWWRVWRPTLALKNFKAVRITKVKAHATNEDIAQGLITPRSRAAWCACRKCWPSRRIATTNRWIRATSLV